ncbi:MAG: LysM peptidoglycan-binding domain-containing protein [Anaerolineales bacterium]|nr:LysM peptidoglycan-binding domain-containing protein [Anaerolineales bacterium]
MRKSFSFILLLLTACAPQQIQSTPKPVDLIPYFTQTSQAPLPLTPEGLVPLKTPLPTSTPFTYSVKAGDTISSIALQFGVTIDELLSINPEVNANAMSVGTTLKIPSVPDNPTGEATPTPLRSLSNRSNVIQQRIKACGVLCLLTMIHLSSWKTSVRK